MLQEQKTKAQVTAPEKIAVHAIMLSVEMEANFKLYSYRVIDRSNFVERVESLISIYEEEKRKAVAEIETSVE